MNPNQNDLETLPSRVEWLVLAAAILIFLISARMDSLTSSPVIDEPVHLTSGYTALTCGDFRVSPEHPPLAKIIAALPLALDRPWPPEFDQISTDARPEATIVRRFLGASWALALINPYSNPLAHAFFYGFSDEVFQRTDAASNTAIPGDELYTSRDFLNDSSAMIREGRLLPLLFGVIVILVVFAWSRALFGAAGAIASTLLVSFDPNFIAHSGLVTTDVAAVAMIALSAFAARCFATRGIVPTIGTGVAVGLALASKLTGVVAPPLVVGILVFEWARERELPLRTRVVGATWRVLLVGAAAWIVLWGCYGFRWSAVPDPDRAALEERAALAFRPELGSIRGLTEPGHFPFREVVALDAARRGHQPPAAALATPETVNLPLVSRALVPLYEWQALPEGWLYGLIYARTFEQRANYLNGEIREGGFPSYFLWTALFKVPVPILLAILSGFILSFRALRPGDLAPLVGAVVFVAAFLATAQVNIGHRHSLVVYPFLYVLAGSLGRLLTRRWQGTAALFAILAISANVVFPIGSTPQLMWANHLAYMNEVAGGPANGWKHLVDSNLDWGQDIARIPAWLEEHGIDEVVAVSLSGIADPRAYGFRHINTTPGYSFEREVPPSELNGVRYLVISVNHVVGYQLGESDQLSVRQLLTGAELIGRIGGSLQVYRLGSTSTR